MRKILVILSLFLIVGCSRANDDLLEVFNASKSKVDSLEIPVSNNHNKGLFSYYLPKSIGVLQSNNISSILSSDNEQIFMSVNVSSVMSDKAKTSDLNSEDFELIQKFELVGRDATYEGSIIIEHLENKQYLVYVFVNDVFFLSSTKKAMIPKILDEVFLIARSLEVDKKSIVKEFSNKETFSFEKEVIELFSDSIPEEGMIKDIIIEEAGD